MVRFGLERERPDNGGYTYSLMASYATEREIIARFLSVFGIPSPRLNDPNAGLKKDTGADVVWTHDEGQTAFQVTEYHSDKGLGPNQKGSQLRRAEKAKAATGRPYAMWVRPDPIPALISTITIHRQGRVVRFRRHQIPQLSPTTRGHDADRTRRWAWPRLPPRASGGVSGSRADPGRDRGVRTGFQSTP